MWNILQSKRSKILLVGVIVVSAVIFGKSFLAYATSFIDSFTDSSRVADTWNTTVNTGAGTVALTARTCDDANWFCSLNTTCADTLGDGTNIIVKRTNESSMYAWKATATACDKPTCGTDGGQDGDNLVADNTVNFGLYAARNACKSAGGRLPTLTELQCLYNNAATFGNNFGASAYWSSTENSASNAWGVLFDYGSTFGDTKTNALSVRCVRGW